MLSYGFGDPITGFTNPHNETRRDTSHLSVGHTPSSFGGSSSRGAFAFPSRGHRVITSTTHFGTVEGRPLFLYLFLLFTKNCNLVHGLDPIRVLGHDHGPVLGVEVWVGLGRTCGWTCDAPKVVLLYLRRRWSLYWCA